MEPLTSQLSFSLPALAFILLVGLYIRRLVDWKARTKGLSLPPGPRGLPVLGNMLDVPNSKPWIWYKQLSDKYGAFDFMTLQRFAQVYFVPYNMKL